MITDIPRRPFRVLAPVLTGAAMLTGCSVLVTETEASTITALVSAIALILAAELAIWLGFLRPRPLGHIPPQLEAIISTRVPAATTYPNPREIERASLRRCSDLGRI